MQPLVLNLMRAIKRLRHNITKTELLAPLVWLRHRGISSGDVLVASYPRSGSTWLRFLLFEVLTGESAEFETVNRAIPRPGDHVQAPRLLPGGGRLIQTHEPYRTEYYKAIYLVRDVRDVVISEYFYQNGKGLYTKSFDDFVRAFVRGSVNGYGPWDYNVNSWLDAIFAKSVDGLVIRFEDMRQNPEETVSRILAFLRVRADAGSIQAAIYNNSIDRMREKESQARETVFRTWKNDHRFVRSGSVGGWHQALTGEQIRLIEEHSRDALIRLGYRLTSSTEKTDSDR